MRLFAETIIIMPSVASRQRIGNSKRADALALVVGDRHDDRDRRAGEDQDLGEDSEAVDDEQAGEHQVMAARRVSG